VPDCTLWGLEILMRYLRPTAIDPSTASIALVAAIAVWSAPSVSMAQDGCVLGGSSLTYLARLDSGPITAPSAGETRVMRFENLSLVAGWPRYRFEASADLGLGSEFFYCRINGGDWRQVYFNSERDCASPPNCTNSGLDGFGWWQGTTLEVEIAASPGVTASTCPEAYIRLIVHFDAYMDDDCNGNRQDDACDIYYGLLPDCDGNGWADSCQIARLPDTDCNGNGIPDCCDADAGARDCDQNGRLDECQIKADPSLDCNQNGQLDTCEIAYGFETDLNHNGIPDACDVAAGRLRDCNENQVADIVELQDPSNDLNGDSILDSCLVASPDLFLDGMVNSADLAVLLSLWGTSDPRPDLDGDGVVLGSDLTMLLSSWGHVGICGDGVRDPYENCCNCPEDAGCGDGYDCFRGECVPCPDGQCVPQGFPDECQFIYGYGVPPCQTCTDPTYGTEAIPCYGVPTGELLCSSLLLGKSSAQRFSMRIADAGVAGQGIALASFSLLLLTSLPSGLRRRLRLPRIRK